MGIKVHVPIRQAIFFAVAALFAVTVLVSNIASMQIASAEATQVGTDQVTINPGGGVLANGSDGIRFTINSDEYEPEEEEDERDEAQAGQDGVVYKDTYQYCCSAGGPMLNIGGQLYGQAGPADEDEIPAWDSIQIVSTTGSTATGTRTSTVGSGSAKVRYTVVNGGLTYTVDRTVSYTHPNNYVTDTYSYTIPAGNTKPVKFYLGGDTAPGSDDSGLGIMLTEPKRTVISLNPESEIMFGFREAPGSKKFDGATSQDYDIPYDAVVAGEDIGFVVDDNTEETHDAGLMMQWNLGTTPGTYTHSLQQFVGSQGTSLDAGFSHSMTSPNVSTKLNLSIENTLLDEEDGLGYTFTLPTGLKIAAGSSSNSCGGTVSVVPGATTVTVSSASVDAIANCVISVPIVATAIGTYTITSSSASSLLGGLQNGVGTSSLEVVYADDENDMNGDGVLDVNQPNVTAITSSVSGKTVVLEVDDQCAIDSSLMKTEASNTVQDPGFNYPEGLLNFNVDCGTVGYTTTIKQFYYDVAAGSYVLRKHNPVTNAYFGVPGGVISSQDVYGQNVITATYQVTDGGVLDIDGEANGVIVDPAGLALSALSAPNTGFERTRQ